MLNNIKTIFSIKDLENFTGVKAHTIRIWEKRYGLLTPSRTGTNIRYYDAENFIKLLNINLLYENGYKISKIAKFSDADLLLHVKELSSSKAVVEGAISSFKLAMVNFDTILFNENYNKLLNYKSFREIFIEIFIPLLEHIGFLWQTKSIKPIHEHFISNLIVQKIQANIDRNLSLTQLNQDKVFVLYLPMNEIHEIGLLYLHYELSLRNYKSIYLGQNISIEHLSELKSLYQSIHFISYFTVEPPEENFIKYINEAKKALLDDTENKFWFLGKKSKFYSNVNPNMQAFETIVELLKKI